MKESNPGLGYKLIFRLEASLQGVTTPESAVLPGEQMTTVISNSVDYSWQLFDQVSLQHFDYTV